MEPLPFQPSNLRNIKKERGVDTHSDFQDFKDTVPSEKGWFHTALFSYIIYNYSINLKLLK